MAAKRINGQQAQLEEILTPGHYIFAAGGTGGHIYPAIAVAEQIKNIAPDAKITFFCSRRSIDSKILSHAGFDFVPLAAKGFSLRPDKLISFLASMMSSYRVAHKRLRGLSGSVVIGLGGFASAPAVLAARKLKIPIALINVDFVPGRANKLLARFAEWIFVQFAETAQCFGDAEITISGCPIRSGFANADRTKAIKELRLDENKKTLLVTGASSGAKSVNKAFCADLPGLNAFADNWQIVHLTGMANYRDVKADYEKMTCASCVNRAAMAYKLIDYYDDMPNLYAAADLIVGRAGAVSIAEYAASATAVICLPYPYHKDKHQYLNAGKLATARAAVIVDDMIDNAEQTAQKLGDALAELMDDDEKRSRMAGAGHSLARPGAARVIAEKICEVHHNSPLDKCQL